MQALLWFLDGSSFYHYGFSTMQPVSGLIQNIGVLLASIVVVGMVEVVIWVPWAMKQSE